MKKDRDRINYDLCCAVCLTMDIMPTTVEVTVLEYFPYNKQTGQCDRGCNPAKLTATVAKVLILYTI